MDQNYNALFKDFGSISRSKRNHAICELLKHGESIIPVTKTFFMSENTRITSGCIQLLLNFGQIGFSACVDNLIDYIKRGYQSPDLVNTSLGVAPRHVINSFRKYCREYHVSVLPCYFEYLEKILFNVKQVDGNNNKLIRQIFYFLLVELSEIIDRLRKEGRANNYYFENLYNLVSNMKLHPNNIEEELQFDNVIKCLNHFTEKDIPWLKGDRLTRLVSELIKNDYPENINKRVIKQIIEFYINNPSLNTIIRSLTPTYYAIKVLNKNYSKEKMEFITILRDLYKVVNGSTENSQFVYADSLYNSAKSNLSFYLKDIGRLVNDSYGELFIQLQKLYCDPYATDDINRKIEKLFANLDMINHSMIIIDIAMDCFNILGLGGQGWMLLDALYTQPKGDEILYNFVAENKYKLRYSPEIQDLTPEMKICLFLVEKGNISAFWLLYEIIKSGSISQISFCKDPVKKFKTQYLSSLYSLEEEEEIFRRTMFEIGNTWEKLCYEIALNIYGPILTSRDYMTRLDNGLLPDIIPTCQQINRTSDGKILFAPLIIECKKSFYFDSFSSSVGEYLNHCQQLEIWLLENFEDNRIISELKENCVSLIFPENLIDRLGKGNDLLIDRINNLIKSNNKWFNNMQIQKSDKRILNAVAEIEELIRKELGT